MKENTIIDLPTGLATFYMDTTEPRTPGILRNKNFVNQVGIQITCEIMGAILSRKVGGGSQILSWVMRKLVYLAVLAQCLPNNLTKLELLKKD